MDSTLQSIVEGIQIQRNNCISLAILTAVVYDYILTFSDEVEYIWNRPWTKVSVIFVLARYFGLCYAITYGVLCEIVYVLSAWAGFIFMGAADFVMILRVWAVYSRSWFILGALLTLYTVELTPYLAMTVLISIQKGFVVSTAQVLDFSFCMLQAGSPIWPEITSGAQIALGALMCLLVIIKFIKEALHMHRETKRIRLNRYMNLLVREGMIYFLAILVLSLVNTLFYAANLSSEGWWVLLGLLEFIPPVTLVPRFILGLRALYARDLQSGGGSDLDSAFGLSSGTVYGAAMSEIVFADAGQNEGSEQTEEMEMVERIGEDHSAGSSA